MEKGYTPAQNAGDFAPPPSYPGFQAYPPPPQQPVYTDYPPAPQPPTIISNPAVGPEPCRMTCPSCHADIQTTLKHEPTTQTHLIALCLFCCICWPCVCVPYCMDSCQNANHYCPNCNSFIGTYEN